MSPIRDDTVTIRDIWRISGRIFFISGRFIWQDILEWEGQRRQQNDLYGRICWSGRVKEDNKMIWKRSERKSTTDSNMSPISCMLSIVVSIHCVVKLSAYLCIYVTVYRKIGHNAAPTKNNFFCTYALLGIQILSSPSFIIVALAIPAIYHLTVPFVRLI